MTNHQHSRRRTETGIEPGDVALLIDYENLQVSLRNHFNLTTPKMSLIIQEALDHGRLVLSRAYAPWTNPELSIDAENLYRQGIDLIYTPAGKNSADVRMAVDAVDLTQRMSNLGTIIFVTGDGDLIHPLNYLRQAGAHVVVIGVDAAMSRMLSSAADAVLIYERDLDPSVRERSVRVRSQPVSQQPSSSSRSTIPVSAFEPLRKVLAHHGDGEPMLYQEIGHWLGTDHNLRPRAAFGVPFGVYMENAQQAGVVTLTQSGGNSFAGLPNSGADVDDDIDDDEDTSQQPTGAVRLESLQPEERTALFAVLRELNDDPRLHYFTFRKVLNKLLQESALPRLNESQIRSLLNDLASRQPPILIRQIRQGRTPNGPAYSFSAFTLTPNRELFEASE
ncbi:MAG: NYN domain-containing protein [Thermomicrobiales bacterium]|nr:NYN domain-containing protein [Thermomicrobiales bacterium]